MGPSVDYFLSPSLLSLLHRMEFLHCRHIVSILVLANSAKIPYLSATLTRFATSPLQPKLKR